MEKTIDGIKFNSIKTAGVEYSAWPLILPGQQGPDEDGGVINAVDIDWNDAELGEVNGIPLGTIKTTGDLIKVIQG